MSTRSRRPAAFTLNDPNAVVIEEETRASAEDIEIMRQPYAVELATPSRRRTRFPWARLFWSAIGGLGALSLGLAVAQLVEVLFARSDVLGWIGLSLAAIAALALLVIVSREVRSLLRLSAIEELRDRATATIVSDERADGVAIVRELLKLTRNSPNLARARKILTTHIDDIIDGADLVRLAERHLMAPLDQEAKRLVSAAAKRVTVVTAVSPRAMVDMLFVLVTAFGLMRRLAYLYGGRPGALGMMRLMRLCVAHLTVTGGLAIGDGMVQQVLGHGVIAKLSTRLGEGMLNGLLTARLGLAAIEVTRPLPFASLPQPALGDLAADLLRLREREDQLHQAQST
jgi:putative membrane protein